MKKDALLLLAIICSFFISESVSGQVQALDAGWHHLRNANAREWSEFPEKAEKAKLVVSFSSEANTEENTLALRQYDVKLDWKITLNGQALGALAADEKDLMWYLRISPGLLREQNILEISCADRTSDDIMVGEISLYHKPLEAVLSESHVSIHVLDAETHEPIPSHVTVVNGRGILQTVLADTVNRAAVRPGHIYTGAGTADFGLREGTYVLYAGRGFEYGVDSVRVAVKAGDRVVQKFYIRREVSTGGWAASDTHVHTFTWSRHGDASASERAITLAGEGIELPVMTDHNIHVDIKPFASQERVAAHFTPVTGNELTTPVGHFNIFPLAPGKNAIDHKTDNWKTVSERINISAQPKAVILNHARDVHMGFRPFDPTIHLSSAGMRLDDWEFFPNAMEVINSGSQQTDQYELMRDWFGMLNHGHFITPVGSSDSHDVSRFIVGQARTYIRCNDDDPGNIDVEEAVQNFIEGNVLVSFGLLAEIEINDAYGPGELAPASDEVTIAVKVSGPSWATAERVRLFANGKMIREAKITNARAGGLKWNETWNLTLPPQDIFLVAVADGPAPPQPFWPIAKPYQPTTTEWDPRIFGFTGAVWLDGDRNGKRNSAREYADILYKQSGNDVGAFVRSLGTFDEAVSIQAAALLHQKGKNLSGADIAKALRSASPETRSAFDTVIRELQKKK